MRKVFIMLFLIMSFPVIGKTSYIPIYYSSIQFVHHGDTITTESHNMQYDALSQDGTICVYIQHEDVTAEKVKSIKRAKAAAGWASVSAIVSTFAMVASAGSSRFTSNLINAHVAANMAGFAAINAVSEQVLSIGLWIDNNSDGEIMINDMERGLTWYVLPRQSLQLPVQNPDAARLRICNADGDIRSVKYVTVAVASLAEKKEIDYEDNNRWITKGVVTREKDGQTYQKMEYAIIDKHTFERKTMKKAEYEDLIKSLTP